jgi:hypothetical protein
MELFFPYTFVAASGLLPAQFSYTVTMIRTVDSYFCSIVCNGQPNGNLQIFVQEKFTPAGNDAGSLFRRGPKNQPAPLQLACNP